MKRSDIAKEYQWDLTTLFKDQKAFEKQYQDARSLLEKLTAKQGTITKTKDAFIQFMNDQETFSRYLDNLSSYANMCADVMPEDRVVQNNRSLTMKLYQDCLEKLNFVDLELIANKDVVEIYLADDDCKDFRYPIDEIFRTIPHRLDEREEMLMAQVNELMVNPSEIYDALRLEFEPVTIGGEELFLNEATYTEFLKHPVRDVRKQAFTHLFQEYKRYDNAFAKMLGGHAYGQVLNAKIRHFDSALDASLFEDGADRSLFDKVLHMANVKYQQPLHDYFAFRKEYLKLEEQHTYDILLPLAESEQQNYSIEECYDILHKALKPLGDEYLELLNQAKKEHWVDYMTHTGKRSGAYSGGSYDSNPFVLMNFTGGYDSLSTLAHELGHSMHSYYSHKNNRPMLANYRIFVAEVASTVNEILLNKYLLSTSDDKAYKAYILTNLLEQLVGTLYRQPMYAQFELDLHTFIEKGEPVSSGKLTEDFLNISRNYFGSSVFVDDLEKYKCFYVPHFYYNFYVYKYTLGMSVALSFVKKILSGDTADYMKFLSKGGSESPIDELVNSGVDPRDDQVYDDAFTFFKETLEECKELLLNNQ